MKRVSGFSDLTFFHHASLQTLLETTGLTAFPPVLGDLTLVHSRTAILDVA